MSDVHLAYGYAVTVVCGCTCAANGAGTPSTSSFLRGLSKSSVVTPFPNFVMPMTGGSPFLQNSHSPNGKSLAEFNLIPRKMWTYQAACSQPTGMHPLQPVRAHRRSTQRQLLTRRFWSPNGRRYLFLYPYVGHFLTCTHQYLRPLL